MKARMLVITSLSLALIAISHSAQAAPQKGLLFSVGQADQPSGEIGVGLASLGYSDIQVVDDTRQLAWSLGYRHVIRSNWSMEVQYLQQGQTKPAVQMTLIPGKTDSQAAQDVTKSMPQRGQGLSGLISYHYPLSSKLDLQIGGGMFVWKSKRTATIGSTSHTRRDSGIDPMIQFGLSYPLSARVRLEGHWQYMWMPDEAVSRVGLGVVLKF